MFKLTSLNLNGIRSAATKGVVEWLDKSRPDCICVQEIKAQAADIADKFESLGDLKGHFHFAQKKGYSGVGVYSRHEPSDVVIGYGSGEFDAEGRYVETRFDTPKRKMSIISAYFPSGSSGEERQQAKFRFLAEFHTWLMNMKADREFILCGDVNIAHQQADLKNWRSNQKNSGFLPEEREWMTKLLHTTDPTGGLVDVYRQLQPDTTDSCYTWWSNRGQAYANNVGWRLDYILRQKTHDNWVCPNLVFTPTAASRRSVKPKGIASNVRRPQRVFGVRRMGMSWMKTWHCRTLGSPLSRAKTQPKGHWLPS